MRPHPLVLGILALAATLAPRLGHACSAPPPVPKGPAGRLAEYDVAARATVVRVRTPFVATEQGWLPPRPLAALYWEMIGADGGSVTFAVHESWKGATGRELTVYRDGPDTCCGMREVSVGDELLVYAKRFDDGKLAVDGYCIPMISIADAGEDLAYLGRGQPVAGSKWFGWRYELLGALSLAGFGLFAGLSRRKRRS